jgi:hypothetical protein
MNDIPPSERILFLARNFSKPNLSKYNFINLLHPSFDPIIHEFSRR